MCTGCFNCILKTEKKCPHYESIKYINNKIDWCDAMIITSPVYSLQVSGQLKNFIDHMSYNFHRPKYFNKKALIITTTAGVDAKEISNYIKEVLTFWGINTTYKLPIVYRNAKLEIYDKQIDKVLNEVFANTGITWLIQGNDVVLKVSKTESVQQAKKTEIVGVVTDARTGEAIIGASVAIVGTTTGVITDIDGKFTINNVPSSSKTY